MIDISTEQILTPSQACRDALYTSVNGGRPPHISTVIRHMTAGVGGIVLESFRAPRGRCTSREAIERFFRRLDGQDISRPTPQEIARQHELADRRLAGAGL